MKCGFCRVCRDGTKTFKDAEYFHQYSLILSVFYVIMLLLFMFLAVISAAVSPTLNLKHKY